MEQLLQHSPMVLSLLVVPAIKWLKGKIQKDLPVLYLLISIGTSVGLAVGGSALVGADEAATNLNETLMPAITLLIHSVIKTKKKVSQPVGE